MKLHVEVTLLAPATAVVKKRKRTLRGATWAVYEGKHVRCEGRIDDDPKGFIATVTGQMFAASLHMAHGKAVNASSIEASVSDGTAPKPKAEKKAKKAKAEAPANGEAEKPTKAKKQKKGKAAKTAEPNGEAPSAEAAPEAAPAESDAEAPVKEAKKAKGSKKAKKTAEVVAE